MLVRSGKKKRRFPVEDEDEEVEVGEEVDVGSDGPVNNSEGLEQKLEEFRWPSKGVGKAERFVFSTSNEVDVADPDNDLKREVEFYKNTLECVLRAHKSLEALSIPWKRPDDFFAEMVKSDEHMARVHRTVEEDNKVREETEKRRREREMRKYGKKVQTAKIQERQKEKKDSLAAIKKWRKDQKRGGSGGDDLEEILEGESSASKRKRDGGRPSSEWHRPNAKRRRKDEEYGSGGPKRSLKHNSRESSADMSSFGMQKSQRGKQGKTKIPRQKKDQKRAKKSVARFKKKH